MARFRACCDTCHRENVVTADSWSQACKTCTSTPSCKGKMQRTGTGPSVQVRERLDNGVMARALDRPADAERLKVERIAKSDPRAGRAPGA